MKISKIWGYLLLVSPIAAFGMPVHYEIDYLSASGSSSTNILLNGSFSYDSTPGSELFSDFVVSMDLQDSSTPYTAASASMSVTDFNVISGVQPGEVSTLSDGFLYVFNDTSYFVIRDDLGLSQNRRIDTGTYSITSTGGTTYSIDFLSASGSSSTNILLNGSFSYDSTPGSELFSDFVVSMDLQDSSTPYTAASASMSVTDFNVISGVQPGEVSTLSDNFLYVFDDTSYFVIHDQPGLVQHRIVDTGGYTISPIPIPAAVWLFGTALIGLVGFSKCRKAA